MSAAGRICQEWYEQLTEDGAQPPYGQDDMQEAFIEGWNRAMNATWEPGGRPAHPAAKGKTVFVVHNEPDMTYYGGGEVFGVFLNRADAEAEKERCSATDIEEFPIT